MYRHPRHRPLSWILQLRRNRRTTAPSQPGEAQHDRLQFLNAPANSIRARKPRCRSISATRYRPTAAICGSAPRPQTTTYQPWSYSVPNQGWGHGCRPGRQRRGYSSAHTTLFERRCGMALLTRLTERTLVNVVLPVTADAIRRRRYLLHTLGGVAGMTLQPLMRAGQRKLGLRGMIEAPPAHPLGLWHWRAFRGQSSFMPRVLVTTLANTRYVLEVRAAMTFLARHHGVFADQRKARHIVIEIDLLAPTGFLVTAFAFHSERALCAGRPSCDRTRRSSRVFRDRVSPYDTLRTWLGRGDRATGTLSPRS